MITNERQFRVTKTEIARFEDALLHVDEDTSHLHPRLRLAMREQFESQVEELREQVAAYEALRAGKVSVLQLDSLDSLPDALVRARIAVQLTQRQLAERLGLKEQQIQRYETTRYAGVGFDRLRKIATALGVTTRGQVMLPKTKRMRPVA